MTVRLGAQSDICAHTGPMPGNPTYECDPDLTILAVEARTDDSLFTRSGR
ncbi:MULTISPECIES: hypothetical protein [unclassified Rhodococcus (in: high G+C Gram-positive bacteria)]|nr:MULTISPECIES: hypothetical protein [unclassified Rhodococcus (in: high G+C Gram-positive bacteria)]